MAAGLPEVRFRSFNAHVLQEPAVGSTCPQSGSTPQQQTTIQALRSRHSLFFLSRLLVQRQTDKAVLAGAPGIEDGPRLWRPSISRAGNPTRDAASLTGTSLGANTTASAEQQRGAGHRERSRSFSCNLNAPPEHLRPSWRHRKTAPGSACFLSRRLSFGGWLPFLFRISSGREMKRLRETYRMQARSVASPKIGDSGCQARCELRTNSGSCRYRYQPFRWLLVIVQKVQAEKSGLRYSGGEHRQPAPIAEQGICFRYEKQDRGISGVPCKCAKDLFTRGVGAGRAAHRSSLKTPGCARFPYGPPGLPATRPRAPTPARASVWSPAECITTGAKYAAGAPPRFEEMLCRASGSALVRSPGVEIKKKRRERQPLHGQPPLGVADASIVLLSEKAGVNELIPGVLVIWIGGKIPFVQSRSPVPALRNSGTRTRPPPGLQGPPD